MNASLSAEDLDRARVLVSRRLGLHLDDGKSRELGHALRERLSVSGAGSTDDYLDRLAADGEELRALASMVTVGETYFYRNAAQCRAFLRVVLPDRARGAVSGETLRILSAGCASGEEPYTLAILALESGAAWSPPPDVVGIDVNASLIDKARRARYTSWSLRQVPAEVPGQYFTAVGREFQLDERIRRLVRFEPRNLVDDDPAFWRPASFDVIFFRNVAIYLEPEATRAIVARCARALKPGGYLFLGDAETLRGISNDFHLRHTDDAFYYQRRRRHEALPEITHVRSCPPADVGVPTFVPIADSWVDAIQRASDRIADLAQRAGESAAPVPIAGRAPATPPDPDVLLLEAVALTNHGRVAEAEEACARLLAIDDLNAGAQYLKALCREHAGDRATAMEHDQAAIYLDPGFAMPHLHLGLLAKRRGDAERARSAIAQALELFAREDSSRIVIFGGGFNRDALVLLCRAELTALGDAT